MGLEQDLNFLAVLALMNRHLSAFNSDVSSAFLGQNIKSSFKGQPKDYGVLQLKFHSFPIITSQVVPFPSFMIIFPDKGLLTPEVVAGGLHQLLIF